MSAPQPLTGDELATIKARAEAATPGPWEADGYEGTVRAAGDCVVVEGVELWRETDAEHIAGMDPATTLRLVAEVERLRDDLAVRQGQLTAARRHTDEGRAEVERLRAQVERVEALADKLQRSAIPGMTKWDYGADIRAALDAP